MNTPLTSDKIAAELEHLWPVNRPKDDVVIGLIAHVAAALEESTTRRLIAIEGLLNKRIHDIHKRVSRLEHLTPTRLD